MASESPVNVFQERHKIHCEGANIIEYCFPKENEERRDSQTITDVQEGSDYKKPSNTTIESTSVFFCKTCKKEWVSSKRDSYGICSKINDPIQLPVYVFLQASDIGTLLKCTCPSTCLKEGDHVAWISKCGLIYHHAIVINVSPLSFTTVEWSRQENGRIKNKWIGKGISACSPLYKIHYSAAINFSNPPELIVSRALARSADNFDNCEHFAVYCTTGCHVSSQNCQHRISAFQFYLGFLRCLRVFMIVFISEVIELIDASITQTPRNMKDKVRKAKLASVDSLIVIEMMYMIISLAILQLWDIPQAKSTWKSVANSSKTQVCCKMFYAHVRVIMRSVFIVSLAVMLNLVAYNFGQKHHFEEVGSLALEIALSTAGGIGGLILSIFVFDYVLPKVMSRICHCSCECQFPTSKTVNLPY